MGGCLECLSAGSADYDTPDEDTRRRQAVEAAEKRQKGNEGRGVKDPEGLKRKQQKKEEMEKKAEQQQGNEDGGLRWQVS